MSQQQANNFNINQSGGATELQAVIRGMLSTISSGELVEVVGVSASGVAPVGFVSVRPLVYKVDGDNNNVERGIIHNVPYFRLQGGKNAIIVDPAIGDIGFCGICSRDISLVKRVRSYAAPNMRRICDISDAVFFGGWSSQAPEQYIKFNESGLEIKTKGDVNINGLKISPSGTLTLANGVIVDTHSHPQGNDSAGNTEQNVGAPING